MTRSGRMRCKTYFPLLRFWKRLNEEDRKPYTTYRSCSSAQKKRAYPYTLSSKTIVFYKAIRSSL